MASSEKAGVASEMAADDDRHICLPGIVETSASTSHQKEALSETPQRQTSPKSHDGANPSETKNAVVHFATEAEVNASKKLKETYRHSKSNGRSHTLSRGAEMIKRVSRKNTELDVDFLSSGSIDEFPTPRQIGRYVITHRYFTGTIGACICLNALYMYFETDFEDSISPEAWRSIEFTFACVFSIEIILRVTVLGRSFFCGPAWEIGWNYFDAVLVSLAVIEPVMFLVFATIGEDLSVFSGMRILRILRILRVARVFRLLNLFKELWLLVVGVFEAMRTLVWAWLLIAMMIFVFGIFITRSVGKAHRGETCGDVYEGMDVDTLFGSLPKSMFTLFAVMTTEGWADIARCSMHHEGWTWLFFVTYLATTTFAMMNVIVAVIVEGTLEQSVKKKGENARNDEEKIARACRQIAKLFRTADSDGDGELTKDEFLEACKRNDIMLILLEVGLDMHHAESLFDILDYDDSGSLDVQEFVQGVMRATGEAHAKDILAVQCDLYRAHKAFKEDLSGYQSDVFQKLAHINSEVDAMHESVRSAILALGSSPVAASDDCDIVSFSPCVSSEEDCAKLKYPP